MAANEFILPFGCLGISCAHTSVATICLGQCLGGAENTAALAIAVVKHGTIGDKD